MISVFVDEIDKQELVVEFGKGSCGEPVCIKLRNVNALLVGGGRNYENTYLFKAFETSLKGKNAEMIVVDGTGRPFRLENAAYYDVEDLMTVFEYVHDEVCRRMNMFSIHHVYYFAQYNRSVIPEQRLKPIVLFLDGFEKMQSMYGNLFDGYVKRIAAVCRFVGVNLVLMTESTSMEVIDDVILKECSAAVCFKVEDFIQSQIVMGASGAEDLEKGCFYLVKDRRSPLPIWVREVT